MEMINFDNLNRASLHETPYPYVTIENFINDHFQAELIEQFPNIEQGGSFTLRSVDLKEGRFKQLLQELESPKLRDAIAEKLKLDLNHRPPLITLRGYSRADDGQIHTDTKSKIVTVLIYFNDEWPHEAGKLRILFDDKNLMPYADEVTPAFGNCLIFKVTDNCWHGYQAYEGIRRSIQLNYVASNGVVLRQNARHRFAAFLKKLSKNLLRK